MLPINNSGKYPKPKIPYGDAEDNRYLIVKIIGAFFFFFCGGITWYLYDGYCIELVYLVTDPLPHPKVQRETGKGRETKVMIQILCS